MSITRRLHRITPWWRRFKRNGYHVDHCEHCGHRFRWSRDARHSFGNRDGKVYHRPCIALVTWQRRAEERLALLDLTIDVAGMTDRDVKVAAELRAASNDERVRASNRAFRVFRDLDKHRADRATQTSNETSQEAL